jgi:hypothetical protein
MAREIHPEVFERVSRVVRSAAEGGQQEVLVVRFASAYCTDRGGAINNSEPEWPGTKTRRRGRDGDCSPPPAQIPACAANAPGSHLGS